MFVSNKDIWFGHDYFALCLVPHFKKGDLQDILELSNGHFTTETYSKGFGFFRKKSLKKTFKKYNGKSTTSLLFIVDHTLQEFFLNI